MFLHWKKITGAPIEGHKNNVYSCIREGGLPVSDVFNHLVKMNDCHLTAITARPGRRSPGMRRPR